MIKGILVFAMSIITFSGAGQGIEAVKGHAHNDYENEHPLHDALDNGFISIEADVHLVNDNLYVSHDFPKELNPDLTLEALYLNPLKEHISKNNGSVYEGYSDPVYLMIDFKSRARPTYDKLKEILKGYIPIISVIEDGVEQKGPVVVVISGNRPVDEILGDEPKLARIDGRPEQLNGSIPALLMPVVSDKYSNFLSWDGSGAMKEKEVERFKKLVKDTHAENKGLRLWGLPDNETVWKYLLDHGVDLINTDHVKEFSKFYLKYDASSL